MLIMTVDLKLHVEWRARSKRQDFYWISLPHLSVFEGCVRNGEMERGKQEKKIEGMKHEAMESDRTEEINDLVSSYKIVSI